MYICRYEVLYISSLFLSAEYVLLIQVVHKNHFMYVIIVIAFFLSKLHASEKNGMNITHVHNNLWEKRLMVQVSRIHKKYV